MNAAKSYQEVLPGVFRWEIYSPEHKVDLTAHAVAIKDRLYIFDPIPLEQTAMRQLINEAAPVAIILSNDNHERAAAWWREELHVPIWAAFDANLDVPQVFRFGPDLRDWEDWRLARVLGGTRGEIAFFRAQESVMVLGDAVTNLPGYDLMLLTEKYCDHQPTLRHSLKQRVASSFDKLLVAHGRPLLGRASDRVARLL